MEARAKPEPTRLIDLETLETDLENRERAVEAPASEMERTRRTVMMRGLAALGITSLAMAPEKAVADLTSRVREVEVAAMRALAEMRAPRSQTEPEHDPAGPRPPTIVSAARPLAFMTGHATEQGSLAEMTVEKLLCLAGAPTIFDGCIPEKSDG